MKTRYRWGLTALTVSLVLVYVAVLYSAFDFQTIGP